MNNRDAWVSLWSCPQMFLLEKAQTCPTASVYETNRIIVHAMGCTSRKISVDPAEFPGTSSRGKLGGVFPKIVLEAKFESVFC